MALCILVANSVYCLPLTYPRAPTVSVKIASTLVSGLLHADPISSSVSWLSVVNCTNIFRTAFNWAQDNAQICPKPGYMTAKKAASDREEIFKSCIIGYCIKRGVAVLSYNNRIDARPPCARPFGNLNLIRIHTLPSPSPYIHIFQFNKLGFVPEFVENHKQHKYREQDIVDHEVCRAKWIKEAGVTLEENEEDIGCQREIGTPRVEKRFIWEL